MKHKITSENWPIGRRILLIVNVIFLLMILILLFFTKNLETFLQNPLITPQIYLDNHPWINISLFSISFIWSEPTSTVFVWSLAILTIIIGIRNLHFFHLDPYRGWWAIALLAWGLGALFAGVSYQAFSYELKCNGRVYCIWTTWFEIIYLLLTVLSISCMIFAQSFSSINKRSRLALQIYALSNMAVYQILLILGVFLQIRFFLTFELMIGLEFSAIILLFGISLYRNHKSHKLIDQHFIKIWIGLGVVMLAYYGYYYSGIPELLWQKGIWFNANDVLHIGLIGWMIMIHHAFNQRIIDSIENASEPKKEDDGKKG